MRKELFVVGIIAALTVAILFSYSSYSGDKNIQFSPQTKESAIESNPVAPPQSLDTLSVWNRPPSIDQGQPLPERATSLPNFTSICTLQDLDNIRNNLAGNYKQTCNIDLSGYNWIPIGNLIFNYNTQTYYGDPFTGVFDGNGYTISNLHYDNPLEDGVGLFAYSSGLIKNVKIVNPNINAYHLVGAISGQDFGGTILNSKVIGGLIKGNYRVGGLIGSTTATTISYSSSSARVLSTGFQGGGLIGVSGYFGNITNSHASGNVSNNDSVGGLVGGSFDTDIINSSAKGTVVGRNYVGGLAGGFVRYISVSDPIIVNSSATGNVTGNAIVGGLVGGGWYGKITKSFASGAVQANSNVGGLIGEKVKGYVSDSYANGSVNGTYGAGGFSGRLWDYIVINSYSTGKVTGQTSKGGFIGYVGFVNSNSTILSSYWNIQTSGLNISAGGEGRTSAQMTSVPRPNNTYVNWDFTNVWNQINGDYPKLRWQS